MRPDIDLERGAPLSVFVMWMPLLSCLSTWAGGMYQWESRAEHAQGSLNSWRPGILPWPVHQGWLSCSGVAHASHSVVGLILSAPFP